MKEGGKSFVLGWLVYGGGLLFIVLIIEQFISSMPILVFPALIILFAWAIGGYYLIHYIYKIWVEKERKGE